MYTFLGAPGLSRYSTSLKHIGAGGIPVNRSTPNEKSIFPCTSSPHVLSPSPLSPSSLVSTTFRPPSFLFSLTSHRRTELSLEVFDKDMVISWMRINNATFSSSCASFVMECSGWIPFAPVKPSQTPATELLAQIPGFVVTPVWGTRSRWFDFWAL